MKSLKDHIHLYLGCRVFDKYDNDDKYLDSVVYNEGVVYLKRHATHKRLIEEIVPHLRRLESITKSERSELWFLVFNRAFNENGQTVFYEVKQPRWVLSSGCERLGIQLNGHIWYDSDLQHWEFNQHEVTKWLLSKHFDLFGLIDAGLAMPLQRTLKADQ